MTHRQMNAPPKEASKLGQFSWALFDWANQPFFTVITTFIFAPYFANVMVGDPIKGQAGMGLHAIDLGHPHRADEPLPRRHGRRRRPAQTLHLLLPGPARGRLLRAVVGLSHRPDLVSPISWAVVVATVGAEMSIVFNNAQLPNIVRPERMGWLSGFGWGLGYCGGLFALFAVLIVSRPSMFGLAANDQPLFGLDPETTRARAPGRPGVGRCGWRCS